jgi:hypothetical protein
MTGSGKLDSLSEAQYWFREVEQIVRWTREEAAREGGAAPADFGHDERWWKAEADIEKAVSEGDYIKTRDLSRAYVARALKYCKGWLDNKKARIAKGVAA